MTWKIPQHLSTQRLKLRPCRETDFPSFAAFMTDDVATQYLLFTPEQRTPEGAKQMFDWVVSAYETDQPVFVLTIADAESDSYVGSCGLNPVSERADEAECFYTIVRDQWGQGYASEATAELLAYAFEELGIGRIEANIGGENPASGRVAEKVGMVRIDAIEANERHPQGWKYELCAAKR